MENNKQSSVEWLVNVVQSCIAPDYIPIEIVKQAKEMHQQEIIEAWENGNHQEMRGGKYLKPMSSKYYIEKYGS